MFVDPVARDIDTPAVPHAVVFLNVIKKPNQSGQAPGPGCAAADLDGDGDGDLSDLVAFQAAFTGAR